MIALLKKDWRINRGPVVGTIASTAVVCGIMFLLPVATTQNVNNRISDSIVNNLARIGALGICALVPISAAFGGIAFAMERRERWSDFLAMSPVSRLSIVASKLTIALVCQLAPFIIVAICAEAMNSSRLYHFDQPWSFTYPVPFPFVFLEFMAFSVAWLMSAFLLSPTIAACISIGFAALSMLVAYDINIRIDASVTEVLRWFMVWSILVGTTCLIGGIVYYLKRFEP